MIRARQEFRNRAQRLLKLLNPLESKRQVKDHALLRKMHAASHHFQMSYFFGAESTLDFRLLAGN
jgi:hypothetical protein